MKKTGSAHDELIAEAEKASKGSQIGALFDFDGTLIAGFSAGAFIKEQLRRRKISTRDFFELLAVMANFNAGKLGFSGLMVASTQLMRGVNEQSYTEFGEEVYEKSIARLIYPEARALVAAHLRKGHTVAIISSATPYQVRPAARDLNINHVLCSELEVKGGEFTGGIIRPTCFGPGKVTAAEKLAAANGVNLDQSYFYSDSDDDLELLDRVGHPRPLNPNPKLVEIAEKKGWPVRRFRSRGRPRATDFLRSVAASGVMVPTFLAGLPIWALTGSKREAQNFSASLFADTASALVSLNLEIKGEHHVWEQRPAVFVFNHQSKADVLIMAKLLRRDIASVGKKEVGEFPILGKIMEFGGMVSIDRKNSSSAIEAMAPLIDEIRIEGKSVTIAPEGTRSVSPKLGPFKKGAFHLAIQAGVPIVPVVIHNALDAAPKGVFTYRPATVEVEVLPPVDTSDWRVESIEEHVAAVRNQFLQVLGQALSAPPRKRPTKSKTKAKANATSRSQPKLKSRNVKSGA